MQYRVVDDREGIREAEGPIIQLDYGLIAPLDRAMLDVPFEVEPLPGSEAPSGKAIAVYGIRHRLDGHYDLWAYEFGSEQGVYLRWDPNHKQRMGYQNWMC